MKILFKFFAFAGVVMALNVSCKKEVFDINQNPNQPTDSTVAYNVILPAALNNTARIVTRPWGFLQNWLGYWSRSGTYAPNAQEESYQITTNFGTGLWNGLYDNLYDYQTMQIAAQKSGADFYSGIARIMKAHNYAILVDMFNNIPYSQALKGSANTTPAYDKGADVYKDLFRQIDTGMNLIKGASTSTTGPNRFIVTDDIMFGSSQFAGTTMDAMKLKWAKFGNTLKLRFLTKLMNDGINTPGTTVSGFDIAGEITKINTDATAGSATGFLVDDATINPGYITTKPNPFYNLYVVGTDGIATQNSVYYKAHSYAVGDDTKDGYYQWNGDPRVNRFYTATGAGHRGVDYGLPSSTENAASTLSAIGVGVSKSATGSVWIISLAEAHFLRAEILQRGFALGGGGTAASNLASGIQASFVSLGLSATQASAYQTGNAGYSDVDITAPAINATNIAGGVYTILSQKWFALNAIAPYEVWSDYRRGAINGTTKHMVYGIASGFRAGPPISVYQFNTATEIPIRLLYPQTEYNYNASNVGAEGLINSSNRIFWDLQ